ncbi:hypothetical protein B0H10DRAFT_2221765 [Mycena sp. CBHHK59/15]|nr:hypothetical protein B0H10DRAFT_2221765 [Mycena sp. CBHHK59/15]
MAPRALSCDWTTEPSDKIVLVTFFASIKDQIREGGSWDQTALEAAAKHMVAHGPPMKGAPKNANSIKGVWAGMKKIHDALVQVIQKRYPGASGWTYDQQAGFSLCDDNLEAWKEFSKHHPVFKLFANKGWEFFEDVKNILPTRARGTHVFNPAVPAVVPSQVSDAAAASDVAVPTASQDSNGGPQLYLSDFNNYNFDEWTPPEQLLDGSQSQPFSDWSQTQLNPISLTLATHTPWGEARRFGWTTKKGKMPQKSSAVSLTKQVERARQLAIDNQEAGVLSSWDCATLSLIFSRDSKAADAYVAEKTADGRSVLAEILLEHF